MRGDGILEPGLLVDLDRAECMRLLRSRSLGRVAYTDHALPTITPVNYAMAGEAVIFRVAEGARLADGTRDAVVAFEVDEAAPEAGEGWSVVVVGMATHQTRGDALRAVELSLAPWPGGERNTFVRVTPTYVTGRRIMSREDGSR